MMTLAPPSFIAMFLVVIRLGTLLFFTPIQAIRQLPIPIKLLISLSFSLLLVSNLDLTMEMTHLLPLLVRALAELCTGLILSLSLYATFAVFHLAGQLIDTQMGLNSLAIFNPSEHSQDPLTGRLFLMLAGLLLFSFDGHHFLIQGLAYSFQRIPLGEFILFNHYSLIIEQFAFMFSYALMLASPVVIGLLIIDLLAAFLTRNMPQVSTYFLALPVKILFGLFLLITVMNYVGPWMERLFKDCFQTWQRIMG